MSTGSGFTKKNKSVPFVKLICYPSALLFIYKVVIIVTSPLSNQVTDMHAMDQGKSVSYVPWMQSKIQVLF